MADRYVYTSLTRIAGLSERPFQVEELPRSQWGTGDYVAVEVLTQSNPYAIELPSGRLLELAEGDMLIGSLGERYATLEATGSWRKVGRAGRMQVLGGGGILGRCTSVSLMLSSLTTVRYRGHVMLAAGKARMADHAVQVDPPRAFTTPTVLIIGTSMSAGKTTAARVIIRLLKARGLKVLGAKLTGAGRYRDILSMSDAGADWIVDFVDAGLPSTVCPEPVYREAVGHLLSAMAGLRADVAVIEAGASPLEPYNGASAVDALRPAVRCTGLCASDPYAVLGVMTAFDTRPDFVTGTAANTEAGIALAEKLTGLTTLNVMDRKALPELDAILERTLSLGVA